MARARNIKPGFFLNDALAECDPLARLMFAGLWCIADRAGRLEDRPKRIKAEVLPHDNCDAHELLEQLASAGFIVRYVINGCGYIQVINFEKHQNPHVKESPSSIPAPDLNNTSTVQALCKNSECTEQAVLIPDSGFLIPDSSSLRSLGAQDAPCDTPHADDEPQRKTSGTPKRATQLPNDFEPDETASRVAAELGVSVSRELPKFRDYHAAKGKPMKDWQAAFRTWLRNAKEFARQPAKQTESERRAAWLADITGRTADAIDAPARLVG